MSNRTLYFVSLVMVALALAPAMAHLLELPNKMQLTRADYLTVQQIYRGWALLGIVVLGALLATGTLAVSVRHRRRAFAFALLSFLCVAGTQAIFWNYTYPANQATGNWTVLPQQWQALRRQWELSHAASAVLNLGAQIMLVSSVLSRDNAPPVASERPRRR